MPLFTHMGILAFDSLRARFGKIHFAWSFQNASQHQSALVFILFCSILDYLTYSIRSIRFD